MKKKTLLMPTLVLAAMTLAVATETTEPPIATLRGITSVNVHVQPLCSFVDFNRAAAVIEAGVRKALAARGINVVASQHDAEQPTLEFLIHCEDIRWVSGQPMLGEAPSAMLPEGAGAPFIYMISARLSRRISVPGKETIQSEGVVWSLDGRLRALSKRPFVALRDDILSATNAFIVDWEKARATVEH
jgi:hypothetical protein